VIKRAILKTECKSELVAVLKMQSQHLTVFESDISECGFRQFNHAQIAINEFALREPDFRQVGIGKVAIAETAVFIFPPGRGAFPEVNFVKSSACDVNLFPVVAVCFHSFIILIAELFKRGLIVIDL